MQHDVAVNVAAGKTAAANTDRATLARDQTALNAAMAAAPGC
jgi:hypothetical protein